METLLINEQFVSQFKYWREGQVRTGMRFRRNLFEHVSKFNHHQRHHAFDLAWKLAQAGKESIVTATSDSYTIWVNLRVVNPAALPSWSNPGLEVGTFEPAPPGLVPLEAVLSA